MICKSSSSGLAHGGLFSAICFQRFRAGTTGMILGTVYDSSGASIAGATVTITNSDQMSSFARSHR